MEKKTLKLFFNKFPTSHNCLFDHHLLSIYHYLSWNLVVHARLIFDSYHKKTNIMQWRFSQSVPVRCKASRRPNRMFLWWQNSDVHTFNYSLPELLIETFCIYFTPNIFIMLMQYNRNSNVLFGHLQNVPRTPHYKEYYIIVLVYCDKVNLCQNRHYFFTHISKLRCFACWTKIKWTFVQYFHTMCLLDISSVINI